jgi:hypothetical protein
MRQFGNVPASCRKLEAVLPIRPRAKDCRLDEGQLGKAIDLLLDSVEEGIDQPMGRRELAHASGVSLDKAIRTRMHEAVTAVPGHCRGGGLC